MGCYIKNAYFFTGLQSSVALQNFCRQLPRRIHSQIRVSSDKYYDKLKTSIYKQMTYYVYYDNEFTYIGIPENTINVLLSP